MVINMSGIMVIIGNDADSNAASNKIGHGRHLTSPQPVHSDAKFNVRLMIRNPPFLHTPLRMSARVSVIERIQIQCPRGWVSGILGIRESTGIEDSVAPEAEQHEARFGYLAIFSCDFTTGSTCTRVRECFDP